MYHLPSTTTPVGDLRPRPPMNGGGHGQIGGGVVLLTVTFEVTVTPAESIAVMTMVLEPGRSRGEHVDVEIAGVHEPPQVRAHRQRP